jgi:hypothetical protein
MPSSYGLANCPTTNRKSLKLKNYADSTFVCPRTIASFDDGLASDKAEFYAARSLNHSLSSSGWSGQNIVNF